MNAIVRKTSVCKYVNLANSMGNKTSSVEGGSVQLDISKFLSVEDASRARQISKAAYSGPWQVKHHKDMLQLREQLKELVQGAVDEDGFTIFDFDSIADVVAKVDKISIPVFMRALAYSFPEALVVEMASKTDLRESNAALTHWVETEASRELSGTFNYPMRYKMFANLLNVASITNNTALKRFIAKLLVGVAFRMTLRGFYPYDRYWSAQITENIPEALVGALGKEYDSLIDMLAAEWKTAPLHTEPHEQMEVDEAANVIRENLGRLRGEDGAGDYYDAMGDSRYASRPRTGGRPRF